MSRYAWDLSRIDDQCGAYARGHLIHWVQFNVSMRNPCAVIPVTAEVDDDGLVHIEGDDLSLVRRHHRPAVVRDALHGFGGRAVWKPRWSLLAVPEEAFFGTARSVFSLETPDKWLECHVWASTDPADIAVRRAKLGRDAANQKVWAEQEIRNAQLRNIDYSHIPPLRIADRYAAGRRRKGLTAGGHDRERKRQAVNLDMEKLRAAAAELGYWPATTDDEHLDKLRADNARFDLMNTNDSEGKW